MPPDTLAPPAAPLRVPDSPRPYAVNQPAVFRRLRARVARNGLGVMLRSGRAKLFTMLATSGIVALFVLGLSWYAFHELFRVNVPVKGLIVGGLFDLMFFTLGVMLVFSTGVILYASLFTSPESRYLLATPARADAIFGTKFQAAVGFSSWAFLILGLPILVAYGFAAGVPWYYYPLLPAYLLGFVILPGAASALFCLLFVRFAPRKRKQFLALLGVLLLGAGGVWVYRVATAAKQSLSAGETVRRNELDGLIAQFSLTRHPLAPSHWMTNGVMAAARDEPGEALLPLAMLWSNGLLAYLAAAWVAGRVYRTGFDRVAGAGRGRQVYRGNLLDRGMELLVFYLDRPTRVLVVKDFRTFRRDPTQWVLLVIMGGLLLIGGMNFRQYQRHQLGGIDRYAISLLNVAGTCVMLCAGLSRFIFPLISLEGRKFWILGLMPIRREQILRGKFAFAATLAVLAAEGLILSSDLLIEVPWAVLGVHALTAAAVAVGLSGLNVGLGAYLPNFRETDPSKIVVGFGGTVNGVLGLMFLVLVVGVMSGPPYAAQLLHLPVLGGAGVMTDDLPGWAFAGLPAGLLAAALAVWLPLRAGTRALRSTEF